MSEISLEKIDTIRKRFGVSYADAKEALESCDGDVVEALVYIEQNKKHPKDEVFNSVQDFLKWLGTLIKKGNINRIKILKDDKKLIDVPVNAGVAAGVLAIIYPVLIAVIGVGAVAAYVTNLTIEITKADGSVQVINKIIKNTADGVKDKVSNLKTDIKSKFNDKDNDQNNTENDENDDENVYKYTVNFADIKTESDDNKDTEKTNE